MKKYEVRAGEIKALRLFYIDFINVYKITLAIWRLNDYNRNDDIVLLIMEVQNDWVCASKCNC